MKKLKAIIGVLASSLMLGAAVGISSIHNNQEAQPVEAAGNFTVGSTLFFRSTLSWWYEAGAATYAYFFNDSTSTNYWQKMDYNYFSDNFAWCTVPSGTWPNVIFVRTNGGSGWGNKWNQTGNKSAGEGDCFVVNGGSGDNCTGSWSTFSSQQTWQVGVGSTTTNLTYRNNSEGAVFYSTSVDITAESSLYIHRAAGTGAEGWFKSQYFEEGTGSAVNKGYIKKNGNDQDATCLKNGTLEFYVKMNAQLVWTQVSSTTEADEYAQTFLTTIKCTGSATNFNINVWNNVSGTDSMEYKFSQLTTGAKDLLTGATASQSGSNVQKCVARYDYILGKYGYGTASGKYHDFMNRTPAQFNALKVDILSPLMESNGGSSALVIIIVSAISVTAIGGYFFLRKRKQER